MRKFVSALIVVFIVFAAAAAEEFGAVVTKFDDGKITLKKFKKGEKGGEATTLTVAANCKYLKAKFNKEEMKIEADGELEGGKDAFAKRVKEAAAKKPDDNPDKKKKFGGFGGVFTQIVTEGDGDSAKVVEIRVLPAFGKKKKDAN